MGKKFQIELTGEEAVAVVKWIIERREEMAYRAAVAQARTRAALETAIALGKGENERLKFVSTADARKALILTTTVLCETRGHRGFRPCKFCWDLNCARLYGSYEEYVAAIRAKLQEGQ